MIKKYLILIFFIIFFALLFFGFFCYSKGDSKTETATSTPQNIYKKKTIAVISAEPITLTKEDVEIKENVRITKTGRIIDGKEEYKLITWLKPHFVKQNDRWHLIKYIYEDELLGSGMIFGDVPYATTTSADGYIDKEDAAFAWDTTHDAVTGDAIDKTSASYYVQSSRDGGGTSHIRRSYLPFDTSALPDTGLTITGIIVNLYITAFVDDCNGDTYDYVALVASANAPGYSVTPADPTTPAVADYDQIGAINSPIKISDDIDISGININNYNTFTISGTYDDLRANGGIIDAVNAPTSNDNTKGTLIGIREGHDIDDNSACFSGNGMYSMITIASQESANDPSMEITYTTSATDTCSCPSSGNWYVESLDNCYLAANCDIGKENGLYLLNTGGGSFNIIDSAILGTHKIESTSTPIKVEQGEQIKFK